MSEELKAWAANSYFKGDDGMPMRWFHGTDVEVPFNIFAYCEEASLGFHFGTSSAANDRLAQIFRMTNEPEGSIIPVYCRAERPLMLNDLFTWDQWDVVSALRDCDLITDEEAEFIADSASAEMLYAAIEEAGYDCVLYTNVCESRNEGGESLMVWRAAQIKGMCSASFDLADPRILSQLPVSDEELRWYESREAEINRCRDELRALRETCSPAPSVG
jgi:hypothetical protein